ncbi:hypothetical protein ACFCZT_38200 [Streptomyces sp. NPDC056230]|uniref:hypothetical protein n=1 Tax=unclassified Streptomyces TaxID=2593676 RepID=UPI0035E0D1A4
MTGALEPREPISDAGVGRVLNPLWIISLFLGLAEITVGVAATQAHGWIQGMLAVFSVVFPSAVALAFFHTLLTRPFVLYAPKDYPDPPSIEAYVTAVSSTTSRSLENVEAAVRTALAEVVIPRLPLGGPDEPQAVVEAAVRAARQDFQRHSVEIDVSGIEAGMTANTHTFPVDLVTVDQLLNSIYLTIADYVDAYSYGREWVLYDPATNRTIREIGSSWLRAKGLSPNDSRGLQEVGINPGSRLLAIRTGR